MAHHIMQSAPPSPFRVTPPFLLPAYSILLVLLKATCVHFPISLPALGQYVTVAQWFSSSPLDHELFPFFGVTISSPFFTRHVAHGPPRCPKISSRFFLPSLSVPPFHKSHQRLLPCNFGTIANVDLGRIPPGRSPLSVFTLFLPKVRYPHWGSCDPFSFPMLFSCGTLPGDANFTRCSCERRPPKSPPKFC